MGAGSWLLLNGDAGAEAQVHGLASYLSVAPRTIIKCRPRASLISRLPTLILASRLFTGMYASYPRPTISIGAGRLAAPAAMFLKKSNPQSFTIQIMDPRVHHERFDLVVMPRHDQHPFNGSLGMSAAKGNVFYTRGSLHGLTRERLDEYATTAPEKLLSTRRPVAVLVGGPSSHVRQRTSQAAELESLMKKLTLASYTPLVTTSRRTPHLWFTALQRCHARGTIHDLWSPSLGTPNPFLHYLALCEAVVVTADSVSMTTEALATGKPVFTVFNGDCDVKLQRFHGALRDEGLVRPIEAGLSSWRYAIPTDTVEVAAYVKATVALGEAWPL